MAESVTDAELKTSTLGFAKLFLDLSLYNWQAKACMAIETAKVGTRTNISVCAPNGSGKDERVIPVMAYWWLFYNPKGQVVITSKSDLQLSGQTIPQLNKHWKKFGWQSPKYSPHYTLETPTGGKLTAFVTNDASRAEGWHEKPGEPLLVIVNEAKSVEDEIFGAIDIRCTPTAIMLISSPGLKMGRFYETHHKLRARWKCISAGLADCPHIPKEKIEHVLATNGPNHPLTRSTLYGEFMESDSLDPYVLTKGQVDKCVDSPPSHRPGFRYGFFDFADGRAENVFVVRDGNKFEIADAWREENQDAVIGRAIHLMRSHKLHQHQVGADAAAKQILDGLSAAGYNIHRQNFGAKTKFDQYKSWCAFAWLETAQKIIKREIIIPDDETLKAQATTRKKLWTADGKQAVEEKYQMQKNGIESPDRMDALVGCAVAVDTSAFMPTYNVFDDVIEEDSSVELSVGY